MFGVYKARMLMFTGQRVTGAELYRRGIVEQCVPPERLMDAAMEIACGRNAGKRYTIHKTAALFPSPIHAKFLNPGKLRKALRPSWT